MQKYPPDVRRAFVEVRACGIQRTRERVTERERATSMEAEEAEMRAPAAVVTAFGLCEPGHCEPGTDSLWDSPGLVSRFKKDLNFIFRF